MNVFRPLAIAGVFVLAAGSGWAADAPPLRPTTLASDHATVKSGGTETTAVLTGSVVFEGTDVRITADKLEILAETVRGSGATTKLDRFKRLLFTGNVHITTSTRTAVAGWAELLPIEEKLTLREQPVVTDITDPKSPSVTTGEWLEWSPAGLSGEKLKISGPAFKLGDLGFDRKVPLPGGSEKAGEAKK